MYSMCFIFKVSGVSVLAAGFSLLASGQKLAFRGQTPAASDQKPRTSDRLIHNIKIDINKIPSTP
jgi:hypothetical protein